MIVADILAGSTSIVFWTAMTMDLVYFRDAAVCFAVWPAIQTLNAKLFNLKVTPKTLKHKAQVPRSLTINGGLNLMIIRTGLWSVLLQNHNRSLRTFSSIVSGFYLEKRCHAQP